MGILLIIVWYSVSLSGMGRGDNGIVEFFFNRDGKDRP